MSASSAYGSGDEGLDWTGLAQVIFGFGRFAFAKSEPPQIQICAYASFRPRRREFQLPTRCIQLIGVEIRYPQGKTPARIVVVGIPIFQKVRNRTVWISFL